MSPFEESVIKWILIALATFLASGIIYKFFFRTDPPIVIKPVPRKVELKKK